MFGYDYPLLGVFLTMMFWFLRIAWIVILFRVIADIFRSHDLGGFEGAVGDLRHHHPVARRAHLPDRSRPQDGRARRPAGPSPRRRPPLLRAGDARERGGTADELAKLADLQSRGVITDAEFAPQKAKLLA